MRPDSRRILGSLLLAPVVVGTWGCGSGERTGETVPAADTEYLASIEDWRRWRLETLQSDTGWLTVAGFHWLEPGDNTFGTDSTNAIVFPPGTAPPQGGVLHLTGTGDDARITLTTEPGTKILVRNHADTIGTLVSKRKLAPDSSGDPDKLFTGRLEFWVIARGGRHAIRVRDPESPMRTGFQGIDSYEIDPTYRVRAHLEPGSTKHKIPQPNIMGYVDSVFTPGVMVFELAGEQHSLFPVFEDVNDDSTLFFVFEDETTGIETYGGGRCFYADLEPDGTAILDFNKAYNPPCAFTPYTTCPLPSDGNRLPMAIRAGEKQYPGTLP